MNERRLFLSLAVSFNIRIRFVYSKFEHEQAFVRSAIGGCQNIVWRFNCKYKSYSKKGNVLFSSIITMIKIRIFIPDNVSVQK